MVTGDSSRPHTFAISLKSSTANDESPPRSKKLSSTRISGNCSKRCQMGVSTSIIAEVGLCFTLLLVGWHREERVEHLARSYGQAEASSLAVPRLGVQVGVRPSNLVHAAHI